AVYLRSRESVLSRGVFLGPAARWPFYYSARRRTPLDAIRLRQRFRSGLFEGDGGARRRGARFQHSESAAGNAVGSGGGIRRSGGKKSKLRTSGPESHSARRWTPYGAEPLFRHLLRCSAHDTGGHQGTACAEVPQYGFCLGIEGDLPLVFAAQSVSQTRL